MIFNNIIIVRITAFAKELQADSTVDSGAAADENDLAVDSDAIGSDTFDVLTNHHKKNGAPKLPKHDPAPQHISNDDLLDKTSEPTLPSESERNNKHRAR